MKHLLIVRHGNATPAYAGTTDFNRPLSQKGEAECRLMAPLGLEWFENHNLGLPDRLLVSTARRTTETAENLSRLWKLSPGRVVNQEELYLPDLETCLEILWGVPDKVDFLAICSHNPGMTYLGNLLFGAMPSGMAPCGMVLGRLEIESWTEVDRMKGTLLEFRNP